METSPETTSAAKPVLRTLSLWFFVFLLMTSQCWFTYEILQMRGELDDLRADLTHVGRLARNADAHAHSHYSDLRLKSAISPLDHAVDQILSLRPVTFLWNRSDHPELGLSEEQQTGLIAQEVEQLHPDVVDTDHHGFKTVDYARLVPLLIGAIQEQQAQIEALEERLGVVE
jgi:hypothetical protein